MNTYQPRHACALCEQSYAERCGFAFITYVANYTHRRLA